MDPYKTKISANGVKFYFEDKGNVVAWAYLYILHNDLHKRPFGLMENVFVEPAYRGKGYGQALLEAVVDEAKAVPCYKLICTARFGNKKVHRWYKRNGFAEHGLEFRLDI
jgi:GNAT superfamily N-acetyltransferase